MLEPQAIRRRERAARAVLGRIHRLEVEAPEPLAGLFAQVAARLFDPELSATSLWRCVPNPARWKPRFRALAGQDLRAFIRSCRLEVALELLAVPALTVARIAALCAFPSQAAFRHAFIQAEGLRPEAWRRRQGAGARLAERPIEPLRQVLNGTLPAASTLAMARTLAPDPGAGKSGTASVESLEQVRAEGIWQILAPLAPELRRRALTSLPLLATPALFHLLVRKSRELGRGDRRRGVPLAELALASLERVDWQARPAGEAQRLRALGWAWLGNAHCQAYELAEAEGALARAEALAEPEESGEIALIQGQLLWYQRRFPEAASRLEQAADLLRAKGPRDALARTLVLRGAVASGAGEPAAALSSLEEAAGLARALGENYLLLSALQSKARALLALERWAEAEAPLAEARALQARVGGKEGALQINWLEGLLALGRRQPERACETFARVRDGFASLDSPGHAALAGLDLALASQAAGGQDQVPAIIGEVMPLLAQFSCYREIQAATALLREALASDIVRPSVLTRARQALAGALVLPRPGS